MKIKVNQAYSCLPTEGQSPYLTTAPRPQLAVV
jgi:hypothetical protein